MYVPMSHDLFSTDWPTPRGWRQELVEAPTGGSCTGVPGLDLEGGDLLPGVLCSLEAGALLPGVLYSLECSTPWREVLYSLEYSTPWREALHWRLVEE